MEIINKNTQLRTLLIWVLIINLFFFLLESITGIISSSMGLVADSMDMLADAIVYGLAIFATGATVNRKNNIARTSGYFQLVLAMVGFAEVIRRFVGYGEIPDYITMIGISAFALIGNAISLYLLQKSKNTEAHIQASKIFTANDVLINIGVIVAGALVYITASRIPDLVVGAIIFLIVLRGVIKIFKISNMK